MSIKGDVNELNTLIVEIKRVSAQLKQLKLRKKIVEERVTIFLKEKEQPGVKYQGVAIKLEQKEKRSYKKESHKKEDAIEVLRKHGVRHPEEALEDLMEARRGEKVEIENLKLHKITKR